MFQCILCQLPPMLTVLEKEIVMLKFSFAVALLRRQPVPFSLSTTRGAELRACHDGVGPNFRMGLLWTLALALLAAVCLPASAASYDFPLNPPSSCSGSDGSYTCDALTLSSGDVLTVGSRTRVVVNGALTLGTQSRVNYGGVASDLNIVVKGLTDIDSNSSITANLVGADVVTLGASSRFNGNIQTRSAAINIGDLSVINGSLETVVAGVINVGANSHVTGNINTVSGAVNIGANSQVDGSITSRLAGVITLGANVTVGGNLKTMSGAINVGAQSNVTGYLLSTLAGAITVGDNATVGGGVGTRSGAITVGTGSSSGGSVCTSKAGAVTINDRATVAGNISTNDGAITVGDLSKVKGSVNAVSGAVTVASSANVGGVANKEVCPLTIADMANAKAVTPVIKSREWRQIFMRQG